MTVIMYWAAVLYDDINFIRKDDGQMILTLSDAVKLKNEIKEKFSTEIHFHDGCGGQHFSIDNPTEELKEFITAYFSKQNTTVRFSENGDLFSVM